MCQLAKHSRKHRTLAACELYLDILLKRKRLLNFNLVHTERQGSGYWFMTAKKLKILSVCQKSSQTKSSPILIFRTVISVNLCRYLSLSFSVFSCKNVMLLEGFRSRGNVENDDDVFCFFMKQRGQKCYFTGFSNGPAKK